MSFKKFSSFDDDQRVESYRKSEVFEMALEMLNEGSDFDELSGEAYPPIIIVSAPRSGSTFLNQLIASRLNVGYVSNLMACFYDRPTLGALLQHKLLGDSIKHLTEFNSNYGVTSSIFEPHEFGYFWSRHMHFSDTCHQPTHQSQLAHLNWNTLKSELDNISKAFTSPTVFKCSIGCFLLKELVEHVPCLVLYVARNKSDNVNSILRGRDERLGSRKNWWSVRPAGFEKTLNKTPLEQVSWQYERIHNAIEEAASSSPSQILKICFDDLISSETTVLEKLRTQYAKLFGFELGVR